MSYPPRGLQRSKFDAGELAGYSVARTTYTGLSTGYGGSYPTTGAGFGADYGLVVDEIVFSGVTNDAATNFTITLNINGKELPFHIPGTADASESFRFSIKPKCMTIFGSTENFINIKANAANAAHAFIRYRRVRAADIMKMWEGGGVPRYASTNSASAGGTTADTAKAIVTGVAGYSVQVLGFYVTGHCFSATAENIKLGYWDGSTGTTFDAGGKIVFRAHARGAAKQYAPKVLVDDTKGCIQGPAGYGLYIQATANSAPGLAGATPTADFNVIYRLVKCEEQTDKYALNATYSDANRTSIVMTTSIHPTTPQAGTINVTRADGTISAIAYTAYSGATVTIAETDFDTNSATAGSLATITASYPEVANPNGSVGVEPRRGPSWWVFDETTPALGGGLGDNVEWFASTTTDRSVRVLGYAGSAACGATGGASAQTFIGVGSTGISGILGGQMLHQSMQDAGAAVVTRSWAEDDTCIVCRSSQTPGFAGLDPADTAVTVCSQLAWGKFGSSEPKATDFYTSI